MYTNQSSFIIQPFRRKYLKQYCERMSQDNLNQLWDDNVASVLIEQGFSIKESPRSVYRVEKLYQALAKYEPSKAPRIDMNNADIQKGVALAYTCFAKPKDQDYLDLPTFTPELVYKITSNHKGSAGLTAWGQTKAESYVRAYERGLQQIKGEKKPDPCVAFKRTQFNDKTRLVWGYPYAMTALEGIFARKLINHFKSGTTPMAFGMPTGVLGSKLRVSSYHCKHAYSTDVSSFDSAIGSQLIACAFRILSTWFDLEQVEPTSGVKYSVIWNQVVDYFIHTPIFMPDGCIYKGKEHGVPSGSYFTQMIDSIVNVLAVGAISSHFNLFIDKEDIYVLGDDILFWSNRDVNLDHIAKYATDVFSMTFNAAKSSKFAWNDVIHYLGRDWDRGIPSLDEQEILIRMTQPETFRKYPKDKEERERAVRMLLMSYAAVYRNGYRIFIDTCGVRARYNKTEQTIEYNTVQPLSGKQGRFDVNPDFLSGLQRFIKKYQEGQKTTLGDNVPLALQFWK